MASSQFALLVACLLLGVHFLEAFVLPSSCASSLGLRQHGSLAVSQPMHTVLSIQKQRSQARLEGTSALSMKAPMHDAIDKVVKDNKIVLFMKGNQDFPQCGFSNTVCQILKACNAQFEDINVLENELLRQGIKEYSQWPTIPQLYIDGEFIGGCDIAIDMYQSGELVELVERVMAEAD